jgi:hypothetical protein
MAFYGKPKKKQGTSVRLTGLFKTQKRGLFVGSVDEKDEMTNVLKAAIKQEKGVVFFLWKNNEAEEGAPLYTLYMDVSQDAGSKPKRRVIEDDPDDEKPRGRRAPVETDDDEVPF